MVNRYQHMFRNFRGSENEDKDPYYHNGNSEPGKGFGHIG